jgi:hypothetical protein
VLAAVRAQTRAVDALVAADADAAPAAALAAGVREALAAGDFDWLWLLDGHAVPAPDALAELLAAPARLEGLPAPALLASKVLLPDGRLHPAAEPWPEIFEKEVSTAACARRMVSLRGARAGSLLVDRAVLERHGPPRADYVAVGYDLEWTARILRADVGYLVPTSRALRADVPERTPERRYRDVRNRVRMLRGPAWGNEEKLWFGFLLLQDVAADVRERPAAVREVARAVSDGLRAGA